LSNRGAGGPHPRTATIGAIETWPGPREFWVAALVHEPDRAADGDAGGGLGAARRSTRGPRPFWATRPLSRDGLLIAKLVFLAVGVALPVLAARAVVTSAGDAALALWVALGWPSTS